MWGCGGKAAEEAHSRHLRGTEIEREKRRKVNKQMMFGGINQDWRTNPDRWILGLMGKVTQIGLPCVIFIQANASEFVDDDTMHQMND